LQKLITWWIENHVVANLLMLFIIIVGLFYASTIKKEVMPEFSLDIIEVDVPYRGATPTDIEESICIKIEERVTGVEGIKKIHSTAVEGMGKVFIYLENDADKNKVYNDIKNEVDSINTFPVEAEKPVIKILSNRKQVINIVIYGNTDEKSLTRIAEKVRDDLTAKKDITLADVMGSKPYEISIEFSRETLRKYHLSLPFVANIVRQFSVDIPGGNIKTSAEEILVRTKEQKYTKHDYEKIPIIKKQDGTYLLLGEIAKIKDGFEDIDFINRFEGKNSVFVAIYRAGNQSALKIAEVVKNYVENSLKPVLPKGVKASVWQDDTVYLKGRINLLIKNAKYGLLLVMLLLAFFLDLRLALWVGSGIAVSFLGAFILMPHFDISINMISLFAFILCLGIVVDDAIVVGEQIFQYMEKGENSFNASVKGTMRMLTPVFFSVSTTIAAFLPLFFVKGIMGKFLYTIPVVVISILTLSLLEAFFILPVHLSSIKNKRNVIYTFLPKLSNKLLKIFIEKIYIPLLDLCLKWRYATFSLMLTILIITVGFYVSGRISFIFFPKVESDIIIASLSMPEGASIKKTKRVIDFIEKKAEALKNEFTESIQGKKFSTIKHINSISGAQPYTKILKHGGTMFMGAVMSQNIGEIVLELVSSEKRKHSAKHIANRWRELVGDLPEIKSLTFSSTLFSAGNAIEINLISNNENTLKKAAALLKNEIKKYPGTFDVSDTISRGKTELRIKLKDRGKILGFTPVSVGKEIRAAFYGDEALRVQRNKDDVRIMVRYSDKIRRSLYDIENMYLHSPSGKEVPFFEVADIKFATGYSEINRENRKRIIKVISDVDESVNSPDEILKDLKKGFLPKLTEKFPNLKYTFEGQKKEEMDTMESLKIGAVIAIFLIFVLLAVPFKSYLQPFIIMTVIPFGLIGAVIGHILMGYTLSLMSILGIVALAGVVVNDSLVMVVSINRDKTKDIHERILKVTRTRFRPIILTSITTFAGLLPMIFEKSLQAQFLIPMAISLGFGVMFATVITLVLIPVIYFILEDIRRY
jgi:multidrug efflux pump subunit AcrB